MHKFAAQYATDVTASRFGEKMEDAAQPLRRASRAGCAPPRRSCVAAASAHLQRLFHFLKKGPRRSWTQL